MNWDVEYTDEFGEWWELLTTAEQESVRASVKLLGDLGPHLGFPHSSGVLGSRHGNMRELRVQHAGRPYRILFAFDPRRCAILLLGGDKTGNDRWYDENVPVADQLYDEHLITLQKEGLKDG
ncbi:type II toxin-antitoxin system RelE/ParE family toxin [Acidithiobacillus ferrooxidans]|uniref:Addiction module toxin RelE n=1 Tax=Acidithiobacillus ferrooxidans TaxID=920 RepID=A0A2W1K6S1_ACIFR|nr:type II toxin-antitoxin system RelE/ParE family toxin [Acidithiobacillus ferrooxidans]MBU2815889.1 addiction module toxin RelE [Acidithiobacillus ferrooxidans]MCR1344027.1 type II toxin-antitoxin system RelE/ParE family toxin [Acidithiobacillus ferrooxidans]PZD82403.1 addiction module toxin RelE [Acidithiobacillus ferrooxidans]QLK41323.1 addiction module toxin RelE [Acidithiobacillus ferrooxidans]QZT53265.1 type II toxin-antitoxin system RelE/ParE family toxin [Acidithiobacillus ferrooxidan